MFSVAMIGCCDTSNALTFLILVWGALSDQSSPNNISAAVDIKIQHRNAPREEMMLKDGEKRNEERQLIQKDKAEEDLFKNVDPKTLASVLLKALNHSHVERRKEGEEYTGMEEERKAEKGEFKKEEEDTAMRMMEGAERDRDRQQELELLMATQGKDQETEEEERKKVQRDEEMTEKVTSHTISQTVHVQNSPLNNEKDVAPHQGLTSTGKGSNEEEEQLNPEELKNLETMMKEFPRLNAATKKEGDSMQTQRESRGYTKYNEIIPVNEGSNIAMSKKKLKWQEETQKALYLPTFRGGNFMDDTVDSNYDRYSTQSQPPAEQVAIDNKEPGEMEKEEDEGVLSPEEEEVQAKAEQEEMRRQAAELQRAKMEEKKLADIASDMLLRYMVKQNNGNKKYSSSFSKAAEDKRSDEEQEVTEEDDIDPQTIDKLIEISSKLHLPADDVVDIISDVEKKKKKDVPPEMTSNWQKASSLPSLLSSTNYFSPSQISLISDNYHGFKQSSSSVNLPKSWFQEKTQTKSLEQKSAKSLLVNSNLRPKSQNPLSIKQWLKTPKSVWTGYASYPYIYTMPPLYYLPYPGTYPIYFPTALRPRPQYYIHKPAVNLNTFLRNNADDIFTFPPKRHDHSWVQSWPRKPTVKKPYYTAPTPTPHCTLGHFSQYRFLKYKCL